ncbi:MAG TPA: HEAT repeat domain-containing protein [Planctomycetota bacterium]|nr:HEAT repeat domain-containing protein [Planctomycetota bacterium]
MNAILKRLTQLLASDDITLRIAAIRVIAEIGFSSRQVVQAIGLCLREPHDELQLAALKALARLGARDVTQMVVPLILSSGPLREQAMAVIAAIGPSVLPQLKVLYPEADFHGKRAVATALARIGGKPAMAFLLKILPGEPFELQKHLTICICDALDKMPTPQQAPIYPLVTRLLRHKEIEKFPQILVTGAILIGHFRGQGLSSRARSELRLLADKKFPPEVRRHAFLSFNRLMGEGKLSNSDEQFLWRSLSDEDWNSVAQHALSGFQRLNIPKKLLPKLVHLLHHSPHFSVHIHIFARLQSSDRPEVAQEILPFLADSRFRVREAAEAALRKMPTSIESLFSLLMKTEDLEVTQRINAILRDFSQETRQKYVERASARLLELFEDNDPHYKSFLDFVKSLDPDPLRKRVYDKAHAMKRSKGRDKWERMSSLLQILWDNHLITAEGRYYLAIALIKSSSKDLAPAARRSNLGLRVIRALIYDNYADLVKRLTGDKDLDADDFFYMGFHFSEEGDDMRPFATAMLEHVVKKYPKSKVAGPAAHKLQLQAKAAEAAREAAAIAAEAERKKELKKQKKLAAQNAPAGVVGPHHAAGAKVGSGKIEIAIAAAAPSASRPAPKPAGKSTAPAGKPAAALPKPKAGGSARPDPKSGLAKSASSRPAAKTGRSGAPAAKSKSAPKVKKTEARAARRK